MLGLERDQCKLLTGSLDKNNTSIKVSTFWVVKIYHVSIPNFITNICDNIYYEIKLLFNFYK